MIVHERGCPLYSVHWLRHAVAAAGMLTHENPDPAADRGNAEALTDAIARFAEQDDWETVTLKDIADHATLMNQGKFRNECTCGAFN
ncbi:hypothetical protein [Streptomyces sp. TRM64462]|uniref:hypothetical protein n=1 Tax=Streptomyces sp. TRM64462 TaxID=2741726 RepID=UPI001586BB30|nr:hypothetical protein [Streptomyces sp. TRM64462]